MTTFAAQTHFTPDDVLRLENEGLYELVDGKLVEKRMSALASETAGLLTADLVAFLRQAPLGRVYPEQTFKCFPHNPDLIRRPDIAFIASAQLAAVPEEGHVPIAPDLAIEIVSPTDNVYELDEKLADYRAAGVKLVWVLNPKVRIARVYRADHTAADLDEKDSLSGEIVLPGFSVPITKILPAKVLS
jgi:Uma2 family endonuclease